MRAQTLRSYLAVHTWVGIVGGFALFVAFLGGAITVFHHEVERWESPAARHAPGDLAEVETLITLLHTEHTETQKNGVGVVLPSHSPKPFAWWQDDHGEWKHARLVPGAGDAAPTLMLDDPTPGLSELLNSLHYSLSIPQVGIYLMGIVSLLYGMALISGLIVHLPRIARDIFALRPGKNAKRFWQDAHNAVGVLSLPFHIVFALTGALLCLGLPLMMAFNFIVFEGKLGARIPEITGVVPAKVEGIEGKPMTIEAVIARAEAVAPGFAPTAVFLRDVGKPTGSAELMGETAGTLGPFTALALRLNDGAVIGRQTADARDTNHATRSMLYGLHFGDFAGLTMRWLYFVLGVAGAFLVYSGNVLWIESRRKRNAELQPRTIRMMARATVGVFLGTTLGMAAAFVGAIVAPGTAALTVFLVGLAFGVVVATASAPARAAWLLLLACAAVSFAIPVVDALFTPDNLVRTLANGDYVLAGVDLVALASALAFALLARATRRRALTGETDSVWAWPTAVPAARVATAAEGAVTRSH
jgi:uncharacterized iron-regulated membrane protein